MIKTLYIDDINKAVEILMKMPYREDIGRVRSDCLYRGMHDSRYKLTSSLLRNCGNKQAELEPSILRYFTKYAFKEDPLFASSVWREMTVGQHYGLPTRLLDWSRSPIVAMHFATSEDDMKLTGKRDGVVWKIDEKEFKKLLPIKYQEILNAQKTDVFSIESLNSIVKDTAEYDRDMGNESIAILEPASINQRIINQYSFFTIMPMGITDMEDFLDKKTEKTQKIIISKKIRWELRDFLDQMNISERIMYPGLDGLSRWIARHYYVKECEREI